MALRPVSTCGGSHPSGTSPLSSFQPALQSTASATCSRPLVCTILFYLLIQEIPHYNNLTVGNFNSVQRGCVFALDFFYLEISNQEISCAHIRCEGSGHEPSLETLRLLLFLKRVKCLRVGRSVFGPYLQPRNVDCLEISTREISESQRSLAHCV